MTAERSKGGLVIVIVIGVVMASSLSGLLYALLTNGRYEADLRRDRDREIAEAQEWCRNVTAYVGAAHAARSFTAIAEAAELGELETPDDMPSATATAELDRWQAEHELYTTSVYLTMLEGYPSEQRIAEAAFKARVKAAHSGNKGTITSSSMRYAARSLDRFVAARC